MSRRIGVCHGLNGEVNLRQADEYISAVAGAMVVDAKGIYDGVNRSESAALAMRDKRSAVEALALKQALVRTRT